MGKFFERKLNGQTGNKNEACKNLDNEEICCWKYNFLGILYLNDPRL